jgi:hypothetical protein
MTNLAESLLIALFLGALATTRVQPEVRTASLPITASDYAFSAPDTVSAGAAILSLRNRGARAHEVVLVLLRKSADRKQVEEAARNGVTTPHLGDAYADGPPLGAVFAAPGREARATLHAQLERGRTYVLVCTLRDTPNDAEHAALGMFHFVYVR